MKKIFLIALTVVSFTACKQKTTTTDSQAVAVTDTSSSNVPAVLAEDAPKVKFEKEEYNFGVIEQGEKVHFDFKFTNTGKTPLIITNASATCGCTIPEYPDTPVKPGEGGIIKVVFNSANKSGMQDKVVTITSNANPAAAQLHLIGEVKTK